MKVFLSWSGERSRLVAKALHSFLQELNQSFKPWMSENEIKAGMRWFSELAKGLKDTNFGIICVTPESINSAWVLFEAGVLSKSVDTEGVCPYCIDPDQKELEGPLAQFQAKTTSKDSTWELISTINGISGDAKLPEDRLREYFERNWEEFNSKLTKAREATASKGVVWRIGDRALALWSDDYWYAGTITDIKANRFFFAYDDGYKAWRTPDRIIPLQYEVNDPVQCNWKNHGYYYPAHIIRTDGDSIMVQYDSDSSQQGGPSLNEEEQTAIGLLRFIK